MTMACATRVGPPPPSLCFYLLACVSDDTPVGQMSGRVGTSLLSALGLPELSFHSVKELEDAAVALVQSPGRLETLRRRQEDENPVPGKTVFVLCGDALRSLVNEPH